LIQKQANRRRLHANAVTEAELSLKASARAVFSVLPSFCTLTLPCSLANKNDGPLRNRRFRMTHHLSCFPGTPARYFLALKILLMRDRMMTPMRSKLLVRAHSRALASFKNSLAHDQYLIARPAHKLINSPRQTA
jgi:hypothetical protein